MTQLQKNEIKTLMRARIDDLEQLMGSSRTPTQIATAIDRGIDRLKELSTMYLEALKKEPDPPGVEF